jgi:hypothetical protein
MKQILPILTLTTLAAAASAQSAPAAGLDYNNASISRNSQTNTLGVQGLLGGSNVLAALQVSSSDNFGAQLTLGYVFKNVLQATDVTITASTASHHDANTGTVYGITLRRQLNEIINGLEAKIGFSSSMNRGVDATFIVGGAGATAPSAWNTEIAYNINKNYQLAVGLVDFKGVDNQKVITLRYNF